MKNWCFSALSLLIIFTGCGDSEPAKEEKISEIVIEKKAVASVPAEVPDMVNSKVMRTAAIVNLKNIGIAMVRFADDHRGRFPENLKELITERYLTDGKSLISPFDKKSVAGSATDFDPVKNCSYVYLAAGMINGHYGSDFPVVFEKPWLMPAKSDSIPVLFADGSSRFFQIPDVNNRSCREIVENVIRQSGLKAGVDFVLRSAEKADMSR